MWYMGNTYRCRRLVQLKNLAFREPPSERAEVVV